MASQRTTRRGSFAPARSLLCRVLWVSAPAHLVLAQSGDDLPTGSATGATTTPSAGEWFAVVAFLLTALALSVLYASKHKSDLRLDTLEHSTLVTSWSTTPERLLAVRCVIMAFMGSTVIYMIDPVHKGIAGVGEAFFWFTNWGYILLTAYFVSIVAYSLKYPATTDAPPAPAGWQQALWLHFEVAGMSALFIDVVLWGILWPAAGFSSFFFTPLMVNVHFINLVMVGIEMSLNRIPVCKQHYFAVIAYTALYGLFATFEHVVLYDRARDWPYFFMDVEHLSYSVVLWYCCLLAIQAMFWLLLFKIDELKGKLTGRAGAANETLMPPGEAPAAGSDIAYAPPVMEAVEPL